MPPAAPALVSRTCSGAFSRKWWTTGQQSPLRFGNPRSSSLASKNLQVNARAMQALEQLREFRRNIPSTVKDDDNVREAMMLEARKLLLDLEKPGNVISRLGFQQMETVACSIAIKSGVFRALEQSSPLTTSQLAVVTGVDPLLLERVLRCLAAHGSIGQDGVDVYRANMVSNTLARPTSEAAIEWDLEFHGRAWPQLPAFLEKGGWKNFTGGKDTPLTLSWNMAAGATIFETLNESPHFGAFSVYMSVFDEGHKPWIDFYPVQERLAQGLKSDPEAVTMVDVGGGLGHQAVKFKQALNLPGRHIVQDFAHSFPAESDRVEGIEYMAHDFNTEQPIKGARFYYLRYVPHDWSQEANVHLCTQLRKAMTPGYSKLIVNEWIIPEVEASAFMTSMDLTMMAASGGMERTEKLHREYLENAGLKVTGIYQAGDKISEGVVEAEVA